jgi:formylglycine-generating enzyme required for sulfatase activity
VLEVNVPRGQRTPWWARDAVHRTAAAFVRAAHCFDEGRVSVPASITATVRAGGLPVLVRGLVPRVPEVSFVIDAGAGSHEGVAPYVELAERLQRSGARVATHRFAGTPARVRRAGGRAARSLASLRARTDLLVMVGDGAMGVDEATRGPASWLRTLRAFPERVWLNPLPQSRWSPGAHAVARATKILAPSSRCFEALAHTRAPRQGGEVSPWFAFAAGGDANALDALHLYLGPTAFRALCCAAVADKPEAQIALALARAARVRLRLEERLRLVTLPCFADGSWPEGLRGRLLDRLEAEQLHAATAAWEALLDAAKPREGSVARHDWSAARVDLDAVKERGRIGWHGEKMPVGMMRAEEQGRYRWQGERAVNIPMVYIPPGTFIRGSDDGDSDEKPQHRCTITKGYYVGLYPVTLAEYARVLAATPEHAQYGGGNASFAQGDDHPAVNVSWRDAQAYCCWAGVRLLTEAEWEYAARGSDGRAYPWGNEAPSKENPMLDHLWWSSHGTSAAGETRAVDQSIRGASPFGALEMSGNVWEWVEDVYGAYPEDGEQYDPIASLPLDSDSSRVLRGGSWYVGASSRLSATSRERYGPSNRDVLIGFRVARGYVDIARGPHP